MSTIEQQPSGVDQYVEQDMAAAVDAQMGKIMTELGSALGVFVTSLGTRSGLWAALAGAGPLTTDEVATRVLVDPALVREWLRAQAAGGYLDYDPVQETFELPAAVAAALVDGPGGALVDAAATMMSSIGEGFAAFSEAFSTGRGFGWHQRTADHWHGTDAFTRVALPVRADRRRDRSDARHCVGAGRRWHRRRCRVWLRHADLRDRRTVSEGCVLGIDYHDASIAHARAETATTGVGNVRFEVAAATELPGTDFDLITFFDSLHDIGDPAGALRRARAALAPTGAVLLFEPMSADDVQDNLNPAGRMFYAVSTLACTPNAVSQRTATSSEPLGAQAGEGRLRALAAEAGFTRCRRSGVDAPMNLILELRP